MFKLILPICRKFDEYSILLTCDKNNVAPQKTIIKNGGILEKEIIDTSSESRAKKLSVSHF